MPLRQWGAWAVHAYTATGALWALLAVQAVVAGNLRSTFLWLFVAVVVDSTDGFLARVAAVKQRLPHFSGQQLDDIVDYLTFVFVPAVIVWRAELVPPEWAVAVPTAMLLSSAYGFVSADAKSDDHFFTGFPSYWNIVVLYLVLLRTQPQSNVVILLLLAVLVFVRIGYVYPTRTTTLRGVTLTLGAVWSALTLFLIIRLPDAPPALAWASLFFPLYYLVLSLVLHRQRRSSTGA